jgi:hypothetical protein
MLNPEVHKGNLKTRLFVETSVANNVGTPAISTHDWLRVVDYLESRFELVVSPISFLEIANRLAGGTEESFWTNRSQLEALSPCNLSNPVFLEMPGEFALKSIFKSGPIVQTLKPDVLSQVFVTMLGEKSMTPRLRAVLDYIRSRQEYGKDDYGSLYESIRGASDQEPNRDKWANTQLLNLGIIPKRGDSAIFGTACDAAYCFDASVRAQLKNKDYSPKKDKSAWTDCQQLWYLCDPAMRMLHRDRDFFLRTHKSTQRDRIIRFEDLLKSLPVGI